MVDFWKGGEFGGWGVKVFARLGLGFLGTVGLEMDENSELEEGEACFHEDEGDDINPDTAFSYIVRV